MKITYINTGDSVGNETDYTAPITIPISAGLKQELLFEEMAAVTNMNIGVYRNGTIVHQQQLVPSSTMRIDLSTFAQVLPSLNELYKYWDDPTSNVQDKIKFVLLDGLTTRTYSFYVCSVNCPYLNSKGWVHHDERNLVSSALRSMVDVSTLVTGEGTKEAVTDPVFGTGTKIKGLGEWVSALPHSGFSAMGGETVTMSIYVDNTGASPFDIVFRFRDSQDDPERIPVGFRGRVSKSFKYSEPVDYGPYIWVRSPNAPMEANFYCFMLNYGSEPKPWIKAGADAASPCVGAMTDYRSGRGFNVWQVQHTRTTTVDSLLVGRRTRSRMYYPIGSDVTRKVLYYQGPWEAWGTVGSASIFSGAYVEGKDTSDRLDNSDGTVYGWTEYENKLPQDVSPNCGVLLRWLNSKGWYDHMFFEKYSIKPVMRTNNGGGNGIDYYETTLQIDVNWDNEPCLNWIQRSSDIIARIPIDVCQFGRATLLETNVFKTQGGSKTKTVQFKIKVQIVEP